jgi:barstar (barnase inhibitor)
MIVRIEPADTKRATIVAIYSALGAPDWAAPNLDALADVLRDLSWREPGPLELDWHISAELPDADLTAIHDVLAAAVAESATGRNPLTLRAST